MKKQPLSPIAINQLFDTKTIRTVSIKDKVYFVAKDVAETLGYSNTRKAIIDHCKKTVSLGDIVEESKGNDSLPLKEALNLGNSWKQTILIQQNDIVRLVTRSKLPFAMKFESWVFDEVIPSVLEKGFYKSSALLANQNEPLWQKQLIPIKKIDEVLAGDFRTHLRQSTIVKRGSKTEDYKLVEQKRDNKIATAKAQTQAKIVNHHKMASSYLKNFTLRRKRFINALLNAMREATNLHRNIEYYKKEISRVEAEISHERQTTISLYQDAKEKLIIEGKIEIKEIIEYHAYDIKIKKERIDAWYEQKKTLDEDLKNSRVTYDEVITFLSTELDLSGFVSAPKYIYEKYNEFSF